MNDTTLKMIKVYGPQVGKAPYRCYYTRKVCGCQLEPIRFDYIAHRDLRPGAEVSHHCGHLPRSWDAQHTTIERIEWL